MPDAKGAGVESDEEVDESDSKEEEDDSCTEQKTGAIKKKLNNWRNVMREVVFNVCPNLHLENQPDINPGLMKHVLDEIRKLKTELAFQHNTILELSHQHDDYKSNNQRKDVLIQELLEKSKLIRLNMEQQDKEDKQHSTLEETKQADDTSSTPNPTMLEFGSIGPCFDLKSYFSQLPESFETFDIKTKQQQVNGLECGKNDEQELKLVGMIESQQIVKSVLAQSPRSLFNTNQVSGDSCEPQISDKILDQTTFQIETPSLSCFDSINNGGITLDSRHSSPHSLVDMDSSDNTYGPPTEDDDIDGGRPPGIRLNRGLGMRVLGLTGFTIMVGRALKRRSQNI
eukprot:g7450.t1